MWPARSADSIAANRPSVAVRTASNGPGPRPPRSYPVRSRPRHALPNASLNVRPIAITSPTDFIVDVSSGSAPGNFSNANRGIFTTT